jgi:hypothetical protein
MFDDFMQNDFPEMHLNQANQDAMLQAQHQAMQQTAQQATGDRMQADQQNQPQQPIPFAGLRNTAMSIGLFIQSVLDGLLRGQE